MTDDFIDPMSPEYWEPITILEELVSSEGVRARHFTFEPKECNVRFDPANPELGHDISRWQVMLGDKGLLICKHQTGKLDKMLVENLNFTMLFKDFDYLKAAIIAQLQPSEPVLYWIRGLIHAFMAENPNVIQCEAVLTGTSGVG